MDECMMPFLVEIVVLKSTGKTIGRDRGISPALVAGLANHYLLLDPELMIEQAYLFIR